MPRTLTHICRIVLVGLASCAAISDTYGDELAQIRQRGTLIWGADAEGGGPFVYTESDQPNQMRGFEVELAELLAQRLGVTAQFQQGQWDKLPDLLLRGDVDIVMNGYEWTQPLSERVATTIPYYVYELQLLARRDDQRIGGLADLAPGSDGRKKRIGVLGGSAAGTYLQKRFGESVELVRFDGNTDAMRATELAVDGLDATLQDLPIVTFYESRFPNLRRVDAPISPGFYVILVHPRNRELLAALNDALLAGLRDGSIESVLRKYNLWNDTQKHRGLSLGPDGSFRPELNADAEGPESRRDVSSSHWSAVGTRGWFLVKAAGVTVALSVLSMPIAIAIGLLVALGRLYGPKLLRWPLSWYVELLRGTPLVLQLFVLFFLLPELGISLPAFWAAVIGLAINYSAYEAEIYRAGLQAIPRGQMEAALSLGMSRPLALRRIIVPQAVRLVIPPVTNDFIALFKDTAVCSVITVVELSKEYYIHAQTTGAVVELGLLTALLYLGMSYPLSVVIGHTERRMQQEKRG